MFHYLNYTCLYCGEDNLNKQVRSDYNDDITLDLRAGTFGIVLKNSAKFKDFCKHCGKSQIFKVRITSQEKE